MSITNSVNSNYAKAGDEITINLKHYGLLDDATGNILENKNFMVDKYYGATDLTKTITQNDTNGNLTFDILVTNSSGYAARVTQEDLSNNNIIIDTIPPTITLNGKNNTISILNRTYTDANATAYDLSYGEMIIQATGTVNVNVTGNYSLSYTAESDLAGNAGPTITRNVIVRDTPPINITSLTIVTDDDTYAKAGDNLHLTLTVNDTINTYDAQILNATIARYSPGTTSLYILAIVSSNATACYIHLQSLIYRICL